MLSEFCFYSAWYCPFQRTHHFVRLLRRRGVASDVITRLLPVHNHGRMFPHAGLPRRVTHLWDVPPLGALRSVRRPWVRLQEQAAFRRLRPGQPLVVCTVPLGLPEVPGPLVFDCCDDYGAFGPSRDPEQERREELLAGRADAIWVTSAGLQKRWARRHGSKVFLVPNGAEAGHFGVAATAAPDPAVPVVGYFGAICGWFDLQLLAGAARLAPRVRFEIVGHVALKDIPALPPNLVFLGARPYGELPALMRSWHAGLIPFVLNDLTLATNPVKMYEYLAGGRPVIATAMPEVEALREPGVVEIVRSAREMADAVLHAVEAPPRPGQVARRLDLARDNTWDRRLDQALATLRP